METEIQTPKAREITEVVEHPERQAARAGTAVSQATTIEQQRAIAEVRAQVLIAKQSPREVEECRREMRLSCSMMIMAEHAFYKFQRGGETVSGPTVGLLRELARCWGNVTYGIVELAMESATIGNPGRSEMLVFAWDLERNVRPTQTFIVPHKRDKSDAKGGPTDLRSLRDIYENNTNQAARRLREQLENAMPVWFVKEAEHLCFQTLQNSKEPISVRVAKLIEAFGQMGIDKARIEARLGLGTGSFTAIDVARLGITYRSIQRGEINAETEFPSLKATEIQRTLEEEPKPNGQKPKDDAAPKKAATRVRVKSGGGGADQPITVTTPTPEVSGERVPPDGDAPGTPQNGPSTVSASEQSVGQILEAGIRKLGLIIDLGSVAFQGLDEQVRRDLTGAVMMKRKWAEAVANRQAEIDRMNAK